jgi:aminopeptidase YwaD
MSNWLELAAQDPALMENFRTLCGFGGRLAGSGQEDAAMDWALGCLRDIGPGVTRVNVPYAGWRCLAASLERLDTPGGALNCKPLLRSLSTPPGGLEGEVLDLGLGRTEDFDRAGGRVRGKIVMVRHEYPFSPQHMHRRRKYDLAVARGATGFLIANPLPGKGLLSGSSGRPRDGNGIPAAYIDFESSELLARPGPGGPARVRLVIEGEEQPHALAGVGMLDIPGGSDARIVISAHMDGHELGQSALDNATGVVVALAAARALASRVSDKTHGLRICFFSAEEWALAGSAGYLNGLNAQELSQLKLNINLDTVAGDDSLTALISDFPQLEGFVASSAATADMPVATYLPLMPNSDHANFAAHGIPALRLVAGFDRPRSSVNNILSPGDVPAVVQESELRQALRITCAMAWQGLTLPKAELDELARRSA